ncbi:MAG: hypothetical protein K2H64_11695 [Desulfovibrio sp.]|nr:hypothetical protein [Desulfovibrio sp.]
MNIRKAREDLGRARTCVQRRDFIRALYLFCSALKETGAQAAPPDLRGDIRTTLADLCADPAYKKEYSQALSYTPGRERDLLIFFSKLYKQLQGAEDQEDYESTLKRKLNLDRAISDGKSFLAQGKASDADACFTEGLKYYKNEIAAFAIMAKAMMEASEYARALGYLKKGLAEQSGNQELRRLAEECARLRAAKK